MTCVKAWGFTVAEEAVGPRGQVPFLQESRCFEESGSMTCSTCYNMHEDEADKTAMFSRKCLTCHEQSHAEEPELAQGDHCTECHMPD